MVWFGLRLLRGLWFGLWLLNGLGLQHGLGLGLWRGLGLGYSANAGGFAQGGPKLKGPRYDFPKIKGAN